MAFFFCCLVLLLHFALSADSLILYCLCCWPGVNSGFLFCSGGIKFLGLLVVGLLGNTVVMLFFCCWGWFGHSALVVGLSAWRRICWWFLHNLEVLLLVIWRVILSSGLMLEWSISTRNGCFATPCAGSPAAGETVAFLFLCVWYYDYMVKLFSYYYNVVGINELDTTDCVKGVITTDVYDSALYSYLLVAGRMGPLGCGMVGYYCFYAFSVLDDIFSIDLAVSCAGGLSFWVFEVLMCVGWMVTPSFMLMLVWVFFYWIGYAVYKWIDIHAGSEMVGFFHWFGASLCWFGGSRCLRDLCMVLFLLMLLSFFALEYCGGTWDCRTGNWTNFNGRRITEEEKLTWIPPPASLPNKTIDLQSCPDIPTSLAGGQPTPPLYICPSYRLAPANYLYSIPLLSPFKFHNQNRLDRKTLRNSSSDARWVRVAMTSSTRQWWRRATAAMKDKRSVYLSRVAGGGHRAEMEAAVIHATSHDERSVDYKNAARVFAWARTSPACLDPLLRALTHRATRTRSWAVALKTLLITHGVLLCSAAAPLVGRLPFDFSNFRDISARPSVASYGFSAFVRAYFQFLDYRSVLSSSSSQFDNQDNSSCSVYSIEGDLEMLAKMQDLLDLLMQIRPYADGMEVGLILEAMNCVIIEIFEVYSSICRGIASFLVDVLGSNVSNSSASHTAAASSKAKMAVPAEERKRLGMAGMRVLRRAAEQSEQLSSYFSLCRSLGVLNAAEIPPVESIPEEDIRDLEALVRGGIPGIAENRNYGKEEEEGRSRKPSETVVTEEWEVFEDDTATAATPSVNSIENLFFSLEDEVKPAFLRLPWAPPTHHQTAPPFAGGNLIELISRNIN
ncbi:hypothetical protein M5K25_020646 [Dendrobium thyrsiflorum]|uniref:ENTH domain-containing protein n=1 Tax=Dendrobium thyrsiflorum TaxID=117978 RepID=A0ABD0UAE5_DENTH